MLSKAHCLVSSVPNKYPPNDIARSFAGTVNQLWVVIFRPSRQLGPENHLQMARNIARLYWQNRGLPVCGHSGPADDVDTPLRRRPESGEYENSWFLRTNFAPHARSATVFPAKIKHNADSSFQHADLSFSAGVSFPSLPACPARGFLWRSRVPQTRESSGVSRFPAKEPNISCSEMRNT
jgi:hypothetical protein